MRKSKRINELLIALAMALIGVSQNTQAINNKNNTKPNIIILFADDISAREIPMYQSSVWTAPKNANLKGGNTFDTQYRAQTPVLDKLSQDGCFFKNTWASTICGPSRAMMMTGRYAHLHKWWHNSDKGKSPNRKESWRLYESSPHTIAHVAKKGGYSTFWAGKSQMSDICDFGFDEGCFTPGEGSYNKPIHTTDFRLESRKVNGKKMVFNADTGKEVKKEDNSSYVQSGWYWYPHVQLMNHPDSDKDLEWWPNNQEAKDTFGISSYGPDIELAFTFDFIERKANENEPFFIYHTSHLGHDAFDFLNPQMGDKWPGTPKVKWDGSKYTRTKPIITGDNGKYDTHNSVTAGGIHNHINYLDYQVWLYMNKLKELGIENNTIFIFCADNGTSGYGKSMNTIQKGTHVPLMIYAPGLNLTKKGEQDILVNISDILPTVAELSRVKIPESYELNGVSLWPYLSTEEKDHRDYIYSYHKESQMMRGKLVLRDGSNTWYDVSSTPSDLISFKKITDWNTVSQEHRKERDEILKILPKYNLHETEHDAPKGGYGPVNPLKIR